MKDVEGLIDVAVEGAVCCKSHLRWRSSERMRESIKLSGTRAPLEMRESACLPVIYIYISPVSSIPIAGRVASHQSIGQ